MKYFSPSAISRLKILFYFGLLTAELNGCKSKEPYVYICKDGPINIREVTDLKYFQNTINPKDSLVILVIRTEEEYKNNIAYRPANIDFSTETLLGGRIVTAMPGHVAIQSVTSSCASNNLVYDVKIKVNTDGITAQAETPFFVSIPKIPETTNVSFNVHF